MRCLRTPNHCHQYASSEDGWGSAGRHSRKCFGLSGVHTQALTVLKPSCGKRVSSCCGAAVQSGGAAGVYLQLGTELGRNVDLHGAAGVVEQMLVPMRSAHRTRGKGALVGSSGVVLVSLGASTGGPIEVGA